MKIIITITLMLCFKVVLATDYYVSTAGNDGNNGLSAETPWATLSKVNGTTFSAGDRIFFKRGDTWYGTLEINQSGNSSNKIVYGAYGTGDNPIITGFSDVTGWTDNGSNIWESNSAVATSNMLNVVMIGGVKKMPGRFPNYVSRDNASNFANIDSHSGSTSITSTSMSGKDFTGGQAVIRYNRYTYHNNWITNHSSSTLTYSNVNGSNSTYTNNFKFFIQNHPATLDVQNEWYYDSTTHKLQIYSTTQPSNVQVSSVANLVTCTGTRSYITLENITFIGSNETALNFKGFGRNILIQNCVVKYAGHLGVYAEIKQESIIRNNYFYNIGYVGIRSTQNDGVLIEGNTIRNVYMDEGITKKYDPYPGVLGSGISVTGANHLIRLNVVDSTGYNGITANTGVSTIEKNYVKNYCMSMDDGGGIYSDVQNDTLFTIKDNIVIDGWSSSFGTSADNESQVCGIYLDDMVKGYLVRGNTIANVVGSGIFLHGAFNNRVDSNTVYNAKGRSSNFYNGGIMLKSESDEPITGNIIKRNIVVMKESSHLAYFLYTPAENPNRDDEVKAFADWDSNYYAKPISNTSNIVNINQLSNVDYAGWKSFSGKDANSTMSNLTVSSSNEILFIYNPTNSDSTVTLTKKYTDAKGNQFDDGKIVLQPFKSAVLVETGSLEPQPVPGMVIRDYLLFRGSFLGN